MTKKSPDTKEMTLQDRMPWDKPKLKAYLSGGIERAENKGAGWRDDLNPWLDQHGFQGINPIDFDKEIVYPDKLVDGKLNYAPVRESLSKTVERDLNLVADSNIIICLWDDAAAAGAGTHGELTMARNYDIPVIIVNKTGLKIPVWIIGCSTYICDSFEELKGFLACIYAQEVLGYKVTKCQTIYADNSEGMSECTIDLPVRKGKPVTILNQEMDKRDDSPAAFQAEQAGLIPANSRSSFDTPEVFKAFCHLCNTISKLIKGNVVDWNVSSEGIKKLEKDLLKWEEALEYE